MSNVDDRIVAMKFDNKQFQPAVEQTMSILDKLKASLNFSGSGKGIDEVQASASSFSMSNMENATQTVSAGFLAMSTIAVTAISKITSAVLDSAAGMAKQLLGVQAMSDGYSDYNAKLTSVQTVMNATGKSMEYVGERFDKLDKYADDTIYDMSDMTSAIAKFSNAGVDLDKSVLAIEGIGNATAYAGQGSGEAALAYRNFSDAISKGFLGGSDFLSLKNSNVITRQFKETMVDAAVAAGTLKKNANGTFDTLGKGASKAGVDMAELFNVLGETQWADVDVLMNTLSEFGDVTTKLGKKAKASATDVKDFPMLLDTLKASAGTGWTETFEIVVGDLEQSKKLWTGVADHIGGILGTFAKSRNDLLRGWSESDDGGRDDAIQAIANAWNAVLNVLGVVKDAFSEVFPPATSQNLISITKAVLSFTENLKMGAETSENLKNTFKGVFSILSIGWEILKGVFSVFAGLLGGFSKGSGSLLGFTGSLGLFITKIADALKKGDGLKNFFEVIGRILAVPIALFGALAEIIGNLFSGFDSSDGESLDTVLGNLAKRLSPLGAVGERVVAIFSGLGSVFGRVGEALKPAIDTISEALGNFWGAVTDGLSSGNFDGMFDILNTVLIGGIFFAIKKFLSGGLSVDFGGGLFGGIKDSFGALTDTLSAMQAQIQAKTLMLIAGAVTLLTVSVIALSLIDSKKLASALAAMAVGFGQLMAAMAILVKISGTAGFVKIPMIAGALIRLSTAVLILTAAVKNLSDLSWEELAKGIGGVTVLIGVLAASSKIMSGASGHMLRAGLAMIPLAIAVRILANAVKAFSDIPWKDLGRGLAGMAGALIAIGVAMRLMPATMPLIGAGLVAVSGALLLIAQALEAFGDMSWKEIGRGLAAMAGALTLISLAVLAIPPSIILTGPGLAILAGGLILIAKALKSFGSMSWKEIGHGLAALGGSIVILAAGLLVMNGTLAGSAALMVAALALAVLTPTLVILGSLSWEAITKGLLTIAGVFLVLGVAGLVLAPIAPIIAILSVSLLAIGAGMMLAGVGALALATAFSIFVAAGLGGIKVIEGMIGLIPKLMISIGKGIIAFIETIANSSDAIVKAFVKIVLSLLKGIVVLIPKFIDVGMRLLSAFLTGIEKNIAKVVAQATRIIVKFITAIGDNQPKIVKAGFETIIKLINGISDAIDDNAAELGRAGGRLATSIIRGIVVGIGSAAWEVIKAVKDLAGSALSSAADKLGIGGPSKEFAEQGRGIPMGMRNGILDNVNYVDKAIDVMATTAVNSMKKTMRTINDASMVDINLNPTITPVLDLNALTREANKIDGILKPMPFDTTVSYSQAADISNDRREAEEVDAILVAETDEPRTIIFEQNNNSPKALSAGEIYRNTRNQLALAREALN